MGRGPNLESASTEEGILIALAGSYLIPGATEDHVCFHPVLASQLGHRVWDLASVFMGGV